MNKGFTLVELLASLAIMSLIIIITIPAYNGISTIIKENSYNSKISMMEKSTTSFVNKYHKDLVYNKASKTICYKIDYLIDKGVFSADDEIDKIMTNPKGGTLNGLLVATYNNNEVDVLYKEETVVCDETFS